MAVAFRAASGLGSGTTTTTGFTLPTGSVATDLLIAAYLGKAYTADVTSGTFVTAYTLAGNVTDGTAANALDGGSTRCHVRWREMQAGDVAPTGTVSAAPSPRMNGMLTFSRGGTGWSIAATTGSDGTLTGTSLSATGAADPGYTSGDRIVVIVANPSDSAALSAVTITVPGCTVGTVTEQWATNGTTSGNDGSGWAYEATISAGTSTGAPSITATTGSGFSSGSVVFMRLRETSTTTHLGTGTLTVTPTLTGDDLLTAVASGTVTVTPTLTGVGIEVQTGTGALTVTPTLTGVGLPRTQLGAGTVTVTPTLTGDGSVGAPAKLGDGTLTITPTLSGLGLSTKVATGQALTVAPVLDAQGSVAQAEWIGSAMVTIVPTLTGAGLTMQAGAGGTLTVTPALTVYARSIPAGGFIMAAAQLADARAQWPDSRSIADGVLTNLLESAWSACLEFLPAEVTTAVPFTPEDVPAYVQANILQARDTFAAYERDGDVVGFDQYAVRVRPLSGTVRQLLRPSSGVAVVG